MQHHAQPGSPYRVPPVAMDYKLLPSPHDPPPAPTSLSVVATSGGTCPGAETANRKAMAVAESEFDNSDFLFT
jgi:hypothetical protein